MMKGDGRGGGSGWKGEGEEGSGWEGRGGEWMGKRG